MLVVLVWALEHGCPRSEVTCKIATQGGHLEVLRWAVEHGCPWDPQECREIAEDIDGSGHRVILTWMQDLGY